MRNERGFIAVPAGNCFLGKNASPEASSGLHSKGRTPLLPLENPPSGFVQFPAGIASGFTLFETVMVIVLVGIIATLAAPLMLNSARSTSIQYDLSTVFGQGQNAANIMTTSLRNLKTILNARANAIRFEDIDGNTITYNVNNNQILRQSGNVLATNTSSLSFAYLDSSANPTQTLTDVRYITFSFTMTSNGQNHTYTDTVFLRNIEQ